MGSDDLDAWEGRDRLRPEIAASWKRVRMSGLDPDGAIDRLEDTDFDPHSQLMLAAMPVLEAMEARLQGTSYCIILADRQCRIVHRWFDDGRVEKILDNVGARAGATFLEESIGTNALGTAFELRKGVAVHGDEHFVEPFKKLSCYGHPIRHPLTKRIEGVLDITGLTKAANPLLAAVIARAVDDIERRLMDGTRSSERDLLAAFQVESGRRQQALTAIGENVVLANKAALDLLQPGDYATMRMLMSDLRAGPDVSIPLSLASGERVSVGATRVPGSGAGALFRIDKTPVKSMCKVSAAIVEVPTGRRSVTAGLPVLISGAPGTGKTTTARELAGRKPVVFLTGATALLDGEGTWAHEFETLMRARTGTLCVEDIHLLPSRLVNLVIHSLPATDRPDLVFTSGPRDQLEGLARTLASICIQRLDLQDLCERGSEMNDLANRAIREVSPQSRVRLTPSVIEALAAQRWPGNLHELKAVMTYVAERRTTGDVVLSDLPEAYRLAPPDKPLAGRERAERDAIRRALQLCEGNKVRAAKELGVSRTTLYARMRALRITDS